MSVARPVHVLVCATLLIDVGAQATAPAPVLPKVSADTVRRHVAALTAAEMAGRGTGQPGFKRAADYVSACMKALGLEPLGEDGYRQKVAWTRIDAEPEMSWVRARAGERTVELRAGAELGGKVAFPQRAAGRLLTVSHADPTMLAPDKRAWTGRVVLVELTGPSMDERFAKLEGQRIFVAMQDRLRDAEPAAVLFVDDVRCARLAGFEGTDLPGKDAPAARAAGRLPNELYVSRAARDRLTALGQDVDLEVEVATKETEAPAWNLVGRLRGADATLAEQCVVVGCHLDHLGVQLGLVHPGADDDGSGSAGMLALAEACADQRASLARSVVFVAFCGEERGLLGSKQFVAKPPIPLESIVAELQLDMIGRCEDSANEPASLNANSLHVIGTERLSLDLHRLCLDVNRRVGKFDLEWDEEDVFFRSDHVNFARRGVPIAFFFTGFHADYHAPTDTAEKLDYPKLVRVCDYVGAIVSALANAEARPQVDGRLWEKTRETLSGVGTPAAPLRR